MAGGGVCVFADPQSASSCWFTVNRFNRDEIGTVSRRIAVRAYRALGYLRRQPARLGAIVEIRRLFAFQEAAVFAAAKKSLAFCGQAACLRAWLRGTASLRGVNHALPGQIVRHPRSFLASAAVRTPSDGQLISGGRR